MDGILVDVLWERFSSFLLVACDEETEEDMSLFFHLRMATDSTMANDIIKVAKGINKDMSFGDYVNVVLYRSLLHISACSCLIYVGDTC